MTRKNIYTWVAAGAGLIGIGIILGYGLGNKTSNTALWIGGILVLLGAVMLGMAISARKEELIRITRND